MKRTRIVSLLLALSMILPLMACAGEQTETEGMQETSVDTTVQKETDTESETEIETEPAVNLYEDLGEADFKGYEFRIMFGNEWPAGENREKYVKKEVRSNLTSFLCNCVHGIVSV